MSMHIAAAKLTKNPVAGLMSIHIAAAKLTENLNRVQHRFMVDVFATGVLRKAFQPFESGRCIAVQDL